MENHHAVVILEISAEDLVWHVWNKINKNGTRFQNCIYSTKPGLSKLPKSTCFRLLDAVSPAVPRTAERFQGRVWSRRPARVLQLKRKSRNIQEQDLGCFFLIPNQWNVPGFGVCFIIESMTSDLGKGIKYPSLCFRDLFSRMHMYRTFGEICSMASELTSSSSWSIKPSKAVPHSWMCETGSRKVLVCVS